MNSFRYLQRQLIRLKIDLLTQRTFLAGKVSSIDNKNIIKTVSTNYEELEIIFLQKISLQPDDVIIDVGCGKGRVFSYLLYKGFTNKMIGYEINQMVGSKTKKRLSRFKNIEIRCDNIFDDFPRQGNIFYLYNPFKEAMVTEFMHRILEIADRNPIVIYNNPIHLGIFDNESFSCEVFDTAVPKYGYSFTYSIIKLRK
ncbi:class I SAM-dependent methyltransferase [Mucilaginibacter sp. HC2]|uniref:class I SAM-dependent methyltransferase n=1 Tax=Mucilaginibacter inviolabilis TaxID=2714892 RepID=UPI00140DD153|nr:class I SAM-dependent methyltransferase [Mucilaginibacter inviolabilis]NHA04068.1 class I SAM-dependent methyltransferase [Mucilaginibacter inviolabilis]